MSDDAAVTDDCTPGAGSAPALNRRMRQTILHWYDAYMRQFETDAYDATCDYAYRCRQMRRLAMELDRRPSPRQGDEHQ